jgi:heat shock protein HslJ
LSGSYTHAASALHFGPLAMTRMACADDALNRQEAAFAAALAAVDHYEIDGTTLALFAGGTRRMRLSRQ